MGEGQYENFSANALLEKASEKYHCFHLHIRQTNAGSRQETINGWKQLMGDNLIVVENKNDVARIIADKILEIQGTNPEVLEENSMPKEDKKTDIIL